MPKIVEKNSRFWDSKQIKLNIGDNDWKAVFSADTAANAMQLTAGMTAGAAGAMASPQNG